MIRWPVVGSTPPPTGPRETARRPRKRELHETLEAMTRAELIQVIEKMTRLQPNLLALVLPGKTNAQMSR